MRSDSDSWDLATSVGATATMVAAQRALAAAGLDARAYRLPWPNGTVVYEVDMPDVIEFKTSTLNKLGAKPTAQRRTVAGPSQPRCGEGVRPAIET
jgi:O-methyltransferase involved in polyketide biosynthesis